MRKQLNQTQNHKDVQTLVIGSRWWNPYHKIVVEVCRCNGIAVGFRHSATDVGTKNPSPKNSLSILSVEAFLRNYRRLRADQNAIAA